MRESFFIYFPLGKWKKTQGLLTFTSVSFHQYYEWFIWKCDFRVQEEEVQGMSRERTVNMRRVIKLTIKGGNRLLDPKGFLRGNGVSAEPSLEGGEGGSI